MLVSILSEEDIAFDVVAVEDVGVACPIVLGVFNACVTRYFALCTALLDPYKTSVNKQYYPFLIKRDSKQESCK